MFLIITNLYKWFIDGLKQQKFIPSQFWKTETWGQGVGWIRSFERYWERIHLMLLFHLSVAVHSCSVMSDCGCQQSSVSLGLQTKGSPLPFSNLCLHLHIICSQVVSPSLLSSPSLPSSQNTLDVGPTLTQNDLISRSLIFSAKTISPSNATFK